MQSYSWLTLRNNYLPATSHINHFFVKDTLMTSFVCEPFPKPKAITSLISLTRFTPLLDSSAKCHQKKLFSSILKFLQDRDLSIKKSLMFKHNASRQKRSNIHTSLHATFSVLRRVLQNERHCAY